jgi:hypothetical protein
MASGRELRWVTPLLAGPGRQLASLDLVVLELVATIAIAGVVITGICYRQGWR